MKPSDTLQRLRLFGGHLGRHRSCRQWRYRERWSRLRFHETGARRDANRSILRVIPPLTAPFRRAGRSLSIPILWDVTRRNRLRVHNLWQVLYLSLRDLELDARAVVVEEAHGADRDSDLLVTPLVALLQEQVRHVVTARLDHNGLELPDIAILGNDLAVSTNLDSAQRNKVVGDGRGRLRHSEPERIVHPRILWVGQPGDQLSLPVLAFKRRLGMLLVSDSEILEFRRAAAEADLAGRSVSLTRSTAG